MKTTCLRLCQVLAVAAALGACKTGSDKGSATPQAAIEFAELQSELNMLTQEDWEDMEELAEWSLLLENFAKTADAQYATPKQKLTILHLASALKKPELARCLLLDGADPNARTTIETGESGDTPLTYAISSAFAPEASTQQIIQLLDILLQGGADLSAKGARDMSLAHNLYITCNNEVIYLHLLHGGLKPDSMSAIAAAAHGWDTALKELLDRDEALIEEVLLPAAADLRDSSPPGNHLACTQLLLNLGLSANSTDSYGRTALYILASSLRDLETSDKYTEAKEMLKLLLSHGADPLKSADADQEYPGFCAYDFLASQLDILNMLKQAGYHLTQPEVKFRTNTALLGDVCRASMYPITAEQLAPHFDTIASILTPSSEMREQDIYPEALRHAIRLLALVDSARASQAIESMSIWRDMNIWEQGHETESLLEALLDTPSIVIDKNILLSTAVELEKAMLYDEAATLIELLTRCADSATDLDKLIQDPRLPLQAGAWQALLAQAGLPAAKDGAVQDWLAKQGRTADTEILSKAVTLTSLEQIWYGETTEEELATFLSAAREICAIEAAVQYKNIADNLQNPDKLDEIMNQDTSWKYELEIATARFLLQHEKEIRSQQSIHD